MSSRLGLNQNDRSRVVAEGTYPTGSGITTADSVKLIAGQIVSGGTTPKIALAGVIEAVTVTATGDVMRAHFDPSALDVDTAGHYLAQMQVTSGGKPYTAPSTGYLLLVIQPDLGA